VDGECFIRKVKTKQGLKLQFIDPQLIDVGYKHDKLKGGRYIRAGIEFDQWGSPVAYHVKTDTGADTYSIGGMSYTRVDAKHMIHGFLPERIGQKRGLPWMATALARMKQLNAYEEAAVVAARVGASKLGFFKSADGEAFQGSEYSSDGEIITDAEPGTFHQLPAGVDFTAFDPGYPTGEFNGFVKSCLRGISSGLGVSYNTLANDLEGVNFSSIRAGVLEDRESWKMLQEFLIDTLCRPLFEEWLTLSLLTGTIKVQGGSLGIGRADKFKDAIWQPRRWSWVDPVKDIQAAKEAIRLGLRSRSDVIREMGKDPGDVWAEIQAERELMQTLDVPIDNSTQMSTAETVSTSVAVEAEEGETPDAPQTED
ncbi:MAG: phage portal protein, partial [Proteobacteria bacterium]|nr:phage portal protein [Pseudomonadota bacterium]